MNKLSTIAAFLLSAALAPCAIAAASSSTAYVYRKPIAAATKCVSAEACAVRHTGQPGGPATPPAPPASEPAPAPETPAFDPTTVIAQGRYAVRQLAAGSSLSPSSNPAQASATNGSIWTGSGISITSPSQHRVIAIGTHPTTGAATYSVVAVADDSDETREAYNAYMDTTFSFSGSFTVTATLAVKPEVCTAVAAAGQSDVTCSGNVVRAQLNRPATPVWFPNAGPFAVFGGYNLQNAAAYQAAENGWRNTGSWPVSP